MIIIAIMMKVQLLTLIYGPNAKNDCGIKVENPQMISSKETFVGIFQ